MSKKPKLCMFCGKTVENCDRTREHFVPRALWGDNRPNRTITHPAHRWCNEAYATDNDYFRDALVSLAVVAEHPTVKKLLEGEVRRKLSARPRQMAETYKNLRIRPIHSPGGVYLGHAPGFEVDWPRIEKVIQNVVRGVYYAVKQRPFHRRPDSTSTS